MKKLLLSFGLSLASVLPVMATPVDLIDQVLEKKVMGQLYAGYRPMINPHQPQASDFDALPVKGSVRRVRQPAYGAQLVTKQYEIVTAQGHYQSLIRITDVRTGAVLSHVSVGRRAKQLLADPQRNRLYVLSGGYFGAVWEIDTLQDVVLRKLPAFTPQHDGSPLWNPSHMQLAAGGSQLWVDAGQRWQIDLASGQVQPLSQSVSATGGHPLKVQIQTSAARPPAVSKLFFMASRNTDFIRMVDRDTLHTIGILPVDFNVDDLLVTPDRKRLFAYHRRFGQVSVIELNTRSEHRFSVVKRYRDARFRQSQPLQLANAESQVLLWDGLGKIVASFDTISLYPKIGVPVEVQPYGRDNTVWVSMPARQRFYRRNGSIYAEYLEGGPSALPSKLDFDAPVIDMLMSADRRHMYLLLANTEVLEIEPQSHQIVQRRRLGMNPAYLNLTGDGRLLHVIDKDTGSLRELATANLQIKREVVMDTGEDSPFQITLIEPALPQVIQIELPRYLTDVVRITP